MVAVAMESTSVLWEIWSLKLLTIRVGCSVVGVVDPVLPFSGAAPVKQSQFVFSVIKPILITSLLKINLKNHFQITKCLQ